MARSACVNNLLSIESHPISGINIDWYYHAKECIKTLRFLLSLLNTIRK